MRNQAAFLGSAASCLILRASQVEDRTSSKIGVIGDSKGRAEKHCRGDKSTAQHALPEERKDTVLSINPFIGDSGHATNVVKATSRKLGALMVGIHRLAG